MGHVAAGRLFACRQRDRAFGASGPAGRPMLSPDQSGSIRLAGVGIVLGLAKLPRQVDRNNLVGGFAF